MPVIAEHRIAALPDRRITEVYDSDAFLEDAEALKRSRDEVVAGNGYHLYLHSKQPSIKVTIAIRIWDEPPPQATDSDGAVEITLESATGIIVVNQFTRGPAGEVPLPRPGVYSGWASWAGRDAVGAYHDAVLQQSAEQDWDTERLRQAWAACREDEVYMLDLHFVRESEDEDEE